MDLVGGVVLSMAWAKKGKGEKVRSKKKMGLVIWGERVVPQQEGKKRTEGLILWGRGAAFVTGETEKRGAGRRAAEQKENTKKKKKKVLPARQGDQSRIRMPRAGEEKKTVHLTQGSALKSSGTSGNH